MSKEATAMKETGIEMCDGKFVAVDGMQHPDSQGQFVYFLHQCEKCGMQIEAYEDDLSQLNNGRHIALSRQSAVGGDWEKELEVHEAVDIHDRFFEDGIGDIQYVRLDDLRALRCATRTPEGGNWQKELDEVLEVHLMKAQRERNTDATNALIDIGHDLRALRCATRTPEGEMEDKKASMDRFIRSGWDFLNAISDGPACDDGSCIRCRIARVVAEVEDNGLPYPTPPPRPTATGGAVTVEDEERQLAKSDFANMLSELCVQIQQGEYVKAMTTKGDLKTMFHNALTQHEQPRRK